MSNTILWEKLKALYPEAEIKNAIHIDKTWTGVALIIDWLLIVVTVEGVTKVELMDANYPYEPDLHVFTSINEAMFFIKDHVPNVLA